MKCNPDDPAVACVHVSQNNATGDTTNYQTHGGLTKREHLAGMVLQGLCSNPNLGLTDAHAAKASVTLANELIAELNK